MGISHRNAATNMRLLLLSAMCVVALALPTAHTEFAAFKARYNKQYADIGEEISRLRIFEANLAKIAAHNADERWTYTLGVNQHADLTGSEFAKLYASGKRWDAVTLGSQPHDDSADVPVSSLPSSVDW